MDTRISWLDELNTKLYGELDQLKSQLDKTELMITDTYFCYSTLDQVFTSPEHSVFIYYVSSSLSRLSLLNDLLIDAMILYKVM